MTDDQYNELAGQIQGLSDFVLNLTAILEFNEVIDGSHLTQTTRQFADARAFDGRTWQRQSGRFIT
jgi:hypothetical protein